MPKLCNNKMPPQCHSLTFAQLPNRWSHLDTGMLNWGRWWRVEFCSPDEPSQPVGIQERSRGSFGFFVWWYVYDLVLFDGTSGTERFPDQIYEGRIYCYRMPNVFGLSSDSSRCHSRIRAFYFTEKTNHPFQIVVLLCGKYSIRNYALKNF